MAVSIFMFLTITAFTLSNSDAQYLPVPRSIFYTGDVEYQWKFQPKYPIRMLRDAILSDDNDALIDILISQYLSSRHRLADAYQRTYNSKLTADLTSRLSGDYANLMVSLVTDTYEFYAQELHDGLREQSADAKEAFVDLLCIRPDEIRETKHVYNTLYNRDFLTDLRGLAGGPVWRPGDPSSGSIQDCFTNRPLYLASRLYQALSRADFRSVTRLLIITINEDVLDELKVAYDRLNRQTLYEAIYNATAGYYQKALLAILKHPRYTLHPNI